MYLCIAITQNTKSTTVNATISTTTREAIITTLNAQVKVFSSADNSGPVRKTIEQVYQPAISDMKKLTRKVTVYARQLQRHNEDLTFSEIMWFAWDEMKKFGDQYTLIKFEKVSDMTIVQRVVRADHWSNYYTPKGTGRPLKEGQMMFIDAARRTSGRHFIISTYFDRIIEVIK